MADNVDVVLEYLKRNKFTRGQAALIGEINSRSDLTGLLRNVEDKSEDKGDVRLATRDSSDDFIVKEIEIGNCGNGMGGPGSDGRNLVASSSRNDENHSVDLYSWNIGLMDERTDHKVRDSDDFTTNFADMSISGTERSLHHQPDLLGFDKRDLSGKSVVSSARDTVGYKDEDKLLGNTKNRLKSKGASSAENYTDHPWSNDKEPGKEYSVKTVLPLTQEDVPFSSSVDPKKGNEKYVKRSDFNLSTKGVVEGTNRFLFPEMSVATENIRDDLPRLPPVRLKSVDKLVNSQWEEKTYESSDPMVSNVNENFFDGSFLDVPFVEAISGKRAVGSNWLSVSQGITEDTSDLVSGFATVGEVSLDYPNEYWDSDEYDDDDDLGYTRQPIEDEAWFLAHDIDYSTDNEKGASHGNARDQHKKIPMREEDDDHSFAEDDSYFIGEQYFTSKKDEKVSASKNPVGFSGKILEKTDCDDLISKYDGNVIPVEKCKMMGSQSVWQDFTPQDNRLAILGKEGVQNERDHSCHDSLCIYEDQRSYVRSIGVGMQGDVADVGSEIRGSLVRECSEGDTEYFHDRDIGIGVSMYSPSNGNEYVGRHMWEKSQTKVENCNLASEKSKHQPGFGDVGFSFPSPLSSVTPVQAESGKSSWSKKGITLADDGNDDFGNDLTENEYEPATWRRKNSDSSLGKSFGDGSYANADESRNSIVSTSSNAEYIEKEDTGTSQDEKGSEGREEDPRKILEDEAAAVQEQVRQILSQGEEFETFHLKIVHRKNRTGFEEDKNFNVVLNSVIAGRYHVTEYLGSAAFSKAIQAHDLHTGMDVCVKIIKNNKDFFDQSLDEIKLLKYINKNDPGDKYHILRLYDYFYYREHLLIICELLKANLYEFHKFNRESGGEVYFTMPRLQSITIQCLEALQFLHDLGLIHCDLKPENILVKSYSRCEIKVIDLGSSCFETDHLCSYVQSRSYRAPEVILGLPYDKKIDIWSLGCILAELCSGNVLFQNDSPASLLARVIGIIGSIDQSMLVKGSDVYKYFTKNHMLYERNQDTNRLEYLIPKKSSLRHRLPMGDEGFIDFVGYLLEVNPKKRPTASDALRHPWLSFPYDPISS